MTTDQQRFLKNENENPFNNNFAFMQVHRNIEDLPAFTHAVVTIGTFDGVHKGHQKIMAAIKNEAAAVRGETVIVTFHPHPRKVVSERSSLQLINTLDEKIGLLQQHGIDHLVVVPFTPEFASLSPDAYIRDFLVNKFHPHTIVIGYDHHFGKNRLGNFSMLEQKAFDFGYRLIEIPKHVLNEIGISSTKIRDAILQSDVHEANELLGYPFFFSGRVVPGDRLGRKIGYPTANLESTDPDKIVLGHGVYACTVEGKGSSMQGMLSIGKRPTVDGSTEKTEVHIFNFDQEIYGSVLTVHVAAFLRAQEKYVDLDALQRQLDRDRQASLQILSRT